MKTHYRLLLALGLGAVLGLVFHDSVQSPIIQFLLTNLFDPLGQIFLRLVFMIVVPMVFCGLVMGACQLGKGRGLGKAASRTLLYTLIASTASVLIGVVLVNAIGPGRGFTVPEGMMSSVEKIKTNVASSKTAVQALVEIIPKNPLDAAVRALDGEMLSLMFYALLFGIALSSILNRKAQDTLEADSLLDSLEAVYAVSMQIVTWAMKLAPFSVFALVFSTTVKFGHQLLFALGSYVVVVILGLLIQQFVVYGLLLKTFTKRKPLEFFKQCREVYLYAFATASSNATLPKSLNLAEHELKISPSISRFVLTVGSTANQNGTALFEGITVLFLAQVYQVDLSISQQIQVVLMSILAGVGTAGVPGGSLPLIMILLVQIGVPAEGLGIILGVDRLLDMCRTTINVSGDLVIAALVDESHDKLRVR